MSDRIAEIENRLNAATPGPWFANRYYVGAGEDRYDPDTEVAKASFKADSAFIAAAPADLTYLLAELRKAQGALADVLAIADIGMNSEHGDPAFIQGWECAIEEMKARIEPVGQES